MFMLHALITSKTRIKLLLKLFVNPNTTAYLRGMADEFNESTNSIRLELNRFEEAGIIQSQNEGNKKVYKANQKHPLFVDINSIMLKYLGIDSVIENVTKKAGNLYQVYLIGDYAAGIDSGIIDLVLIGDINKNYILDLTNKVEKIINKKVRCLFYNLNEFENHKSSYQLNQAKTLLVWENKEA